MPMRKEVLRAIEALAREFVGDRQHVARRHHDDVGLEILDDLHLPLGHAARHRDDGAAEPLGAVMGAQAAGEEAVAIGDVHDVARPSAGGADRARHELGPHLDVGLGVAHHRGLARGAGGGMDAHDLLARDGEEAVGIVPTQVLLGGERELGEIVQVLEVVGMDAGRGKGRFVMRHVRVSVRQRPFEPLRLECGDLIAARHLDRVQFGLSQRASHAVPSSQNIIKRRCPSPCPLPQAGEGSALQGRRAILTPARSSWRCPGRRRCTSW